MIISLEVINDKKPNGVDLGELYRTAIVDDRDQSLIDQ